MSLPRHPSRYAVEERLRRTFTTDFFRAVVSGQIVDLVPYVECSSDADVVVHVEDIVELAPRLSVDVTHQPKKEAA